MAALASFLRSIDRTCPCVYLCDNAAVLSDVKGWIGEGSKASLAKNMDEDIMREILQLLHQRSQANAATILVKVKSHRGEPVNEYADVAANKGTRGGKSRMTVRGGTRRPVGWFSQSRKGMESDTPLGEQASKKLSRKKRGNGRFNCSCKRP